MIKHARRLRVFGVGLRGDGYPNAWQTIQLLKAAGWDIDDKSDWLPEGTHLWRLARGSLSSRLSMGSRLIGVSFVQAIRLLVERNYAIPVYVPYPSVFLLWWLSWVPRYWRPRCIVDAYISIWDSMYRDRTPQAQRSLIARLLYRFERRALRAADLVLTDTQQNEICLAQDFDISPVRLRSLPLAIDEQRLLAIPLKEASDKKVRVLFMGTMIPLHGIKVILDAIRLLRDEQKIEFRLVGSGQVAHEIAVLTQELGSHRITWITDWQDANSLAQEIAAADICLGVFGGAGKASRVLPFKIYMALAAGKAVISQKQHSLPEKIKSIPACWIEPTGKALAQAILALAHDDKRRMGLAKAGREVYQELLSNIAILHAWETLDVTQKVSIKGIDTKVSSEGCLRMAKDMLQLEEVITLSNQSVLMQTRMFMLCRSTELALKSMLLERQSAVTIKQIYGHNLVKLYDALESPQKNLTQKQLKNLVKVNDIYTEKGFEYFTSEDALTANIRYPSLEEMRQITKIIHQQI